MERQDSLDRIDQGILQILGRYESLETTDLWYEIGEEDIGPEGVTEQEMLSRLELMNKWGVRETHHRAGNHTKMVRDSKLTQDHTPADPGKR